MSFFLPSFAKINLGLYIFGKRTDGYHEIFSPILKVSLCDLIKIEPSETLTVGTSTGIPQEENFVYKGLKLFEEKTGIKQRWSIFIDKKIPVGGGLGGGSSNLASVLSFVNDYHGKPLSQKELSNLLAFISSDAPSFLCKGLALAEGRGERVSCIDNPRLRGVPITLFVPKGISSPTGKVYSLVDPSMYSDKRDVENLKSLLKTATLEEIFKEAKNTLGEVFLKLHPGVAEDIEFFSKMCYKKFLVSGSGSSFFTVGSLDGCLKYIDRLRERYKIFFLATI
jgi:4-diphosphocytidyl-2-C-methyl-D-erythritol kinase